MRILVALPALLFSLLAGGAAAAEGEDDGAWLLGRWEMRYASDKSEKDFLEFSAPDTVASVNGKGDRITGRYSLQERFLRMRFALPNGEFMNTVMVVNDRKELVYRSERTGDTTIYQRVPR